MAHSIVGRADEVAVLERFIEDTDPVLRAIVIDGEAGIGKSTLLGSLTDSARARGLPVLECRPSRSETDLSYVGLTDLLAGLDHGVFQTLPGPQARVIRTILRREEPEGQFDRLSLYIAASAAIRALGGQGRPLLLAVDDAQWLDRPTARALSFAVRRLVDTATRLAVVQRTGEALEWVAELTRAVPAGRLDRLAPAPVGAGDLSRILRRALGWAPAWPRTVRIAELSGGNPLYALELARARIAKLPERVRRVVETASILRTPTPALLARLEPAAPDLEASLAHAEQHGILAAERGQLRFCHPILAAAAYDSIPAGRRRRLHRAAAALAGDLEERALHLARADDAPDAQVALALADAAELAWRRGAPSAAADLLRLACSRTPPSEAETLAVRRIAFGRLLYSAGDAPGALAELQSLADTLPVGLTRARALFHLMYVTRLSGQLGRAIDQGLQAIENAAGHPQFQAEVYELLSRVSDNDIERKLALARSGIAAVQQVADPDPHVLFHARAALVEAEFYTGLGIHLERLDGLNPPPRRDFPPVRTAVAGEDLIGRLLTYDGRIDEGLRVLRGMYERAMVENRSVLPAILGWMAEGEIMAGRFHAAAELTREAIERAQQIGAPGGNPWEVGFHAVALAMLGRLDEAEAAATGVVTMAQADPGIDLDQAPALLGLGLVALARGRFADAAAHLRRLDHAKHEAGIREPRLCAHAGDLIDALAGVGELAEAAVVLARLDAEARSCAGRWPLALAARGEAVLCAAHGELDPALASVQRALALLANLPLAFEHARTLLLAGQIHRRRREKALARKALTEALAAFTDLQTPIWAERTRAELARIPQRHSDPGLTPTEQTIAQLAVRGLSNREIADRVFLSPKTVEVNLTRIYRKLGVRSRTALAGLFADQRGTVPDA
ncbi:LuxR C-terminal-related transcriptional regulator [Actinocrinis sp.]|uniref:LuxR C-terminal-related transcriptional regulator n=1 Tax=Actinocrinis sp. TaxID=1920516 RepID=UPI002D31BA41|nr:LuxR C-terminal-related transcriptional regulator [Actinocrinis sp.]HZP53067.1 LuxR C-terminal-related transcriptional regulator [Actinocrinis sp.]